MGSIRETALKGQVIYRMLHAAKVSGVMKKHNDKMQTRRVSPSVPFDFLIGLMVDGVVINGG